ncbi:hypothetical protein LA080_009412 [Diaporthe eres]|nr:hypothetical protein LA080_009412 [Diaporthe eres]
MSPSPNSHDIATVATAPRQRNVQRRLLTISLFCILSLLVFVFTPVANLVPFEHNSTSTWPCKIKSHLQKLTIQTEPSEQNMVIPSYEDPIPWGFDFTTRD